VGCLELGGTEVPGVGDLLALGQPVFFGYGFYRIEQLMKGCRDKGDAQAFTGAMMISVALGSLAWATHDFILPHLHNDVTHRYTHIHHSRIHPSPCIYPPPVCQPRTHLPLSLPSLLPSPLAIWTSLSCLPQLSSSWKDFVIGRY
jgi:hypothetical protein